MKVKRKIVLFTLSYPYGKGEAFLENEISYLAESFDEVIILPSEYKDDSVIRKLPINASVVNDLANLDCSIRKVFFNNFNHLLIVFFTSFFSNEWMYYLRYWKSLLHYLCLDLVKLEPLKRVIQLHELDNAVFYDYWFVNTTVCLSLLKKKKKIKKAICRTHGFDLYDNRQYEKVISFRLFKIKNLDKVYTISKHGYFYLLGKIKPKYYKKIENSYLGVNNEKKEGLDNNNIYTVVSCARVVSFKRVLLTFNVLNSLGIPLKWVHFGGGELFQELKTTTENTDLNIKVDLKGEKTNQEVHRFYQTNEVDLFISLSVNEGLPVSMMEAQSYGIPIVGMKINGVPEIVNSNTGVLFPVEITENEMIDVLKDVITNRRFDTKLIARAFENKFLASKNYSEFSQNLL